MRWPRVRSAHTRARDRACRAAVCLNPSPPPLTRKGRGESACSPICERRSSRMPTTVELLLPPRRSRGIARRTRPREGHALARVSRA